MLLHDSVAFDGVYNRVISRFNDKIIAIAVDAWYVTPYIAKTIFDSNIFPAMLYKRLMIKDGYKEYKLNPFDYIKSPLRDRCTKSKNIQKVIMRHVWQEALA